VAGESKVERKRTAPSVPAKSQSLSGYRIVWLFVLFDLPVGTKKERKAATKFRHSLLDLGFEMSQYSVYLKFTAGKEQAEAVSRQVEAAMPTSGKVHMVQITDKQYENIRTYRGRKRERSPENPDQLALF
jgi:CRISPR-associated protein Cas2